MSKFKYADYVYIEYRIYIYFHVLNNISIRSRTYARESLRATQSHSTVCLFIIIFPRHVLRGSRTLPWYKLKMIFRFAWETFCFKSKSLLIRKFHKFTTRTQCVYIKVYFTVWQFLWFSWLRHYKHIWIIHEVYLQ